MGMREMRFLTPKVKEVFYVFKNGYYAKIIRYAIEKERLTIGHFLGIQVIFK